jgi:toluene monooxygenase system ferredoxin subunit
MRAVQVGGQRLVLVRTERCVFAYEDRCAHLGLPLSDGTLRAGVLTCSAHHYQYDAETGEGINPRCARLKCVAAKIASGLVLVDVTNAAAEELES